MTTDKQISPEAAQEFLAMFGITRRSREFKRLVKANEFTLANFDRVLFESPFIYHCRLAIVPFRGARPHSKRFGVAGCRLCLQRRHQ